MHRVTDDYRAISIRLSRVLGDVGVNHDMVLRRRRTYVLRETLETIHHGAFGSDASLFIFGSQTEGTTSPQLGSDLDKLYCIHMVNVIQDWGDWQLGKDNYLILRDQTTGPGYCHLQALRSDVPLPFTKLPADTSVRHFYTMDDSRRLLLNNTMDHESARSRLTGFTNKEGPATCVDTGEGFMSEDIIIAFPCRSWPYEARQWLVRRRGPWPQQSLLQQVENSGCFIVAKGQKMSPFESLEWRISTSLAERLLMFSMNIIQLQCYFSLKVIIKTFITNQIGKFVSSYHCKTVVFYCIESSDAQLWMEEHLFDCIRYCLEQLRLYLNRGHLPNYFIPEDNLITDRISPFKRSQIVEILNVMLSGCGEFLFSICIDDIGKRLHNSFSKLPDVYVIPPHTLCSDICDELTINMYRKITSVISHIIHRHASTINKLRSTINSMLSLARRGTRFQQSAARFLLPSLCSSLGSMIAASDISRGRDLSPAVTALFRYGVQSDATSSRLKLTSILYCRGEFMRASQLLQDIERRCGRSEVQPVCGCYDHPVYAPAGKRFSTYSHDAENKDFCQNVSYCVMFLPSELPCVPPELQYEMFRSFGDDVQYRGQFDHWMDWSVIDSLPFLHYLQYLVYRQLGSRDLQQSALSNLTIDIMQEHNLHHRETALNLLGKCLEQENRFNEAYFYYARSLRIRPRNNAAKFHMTYLIYQLYRGSDPETTRPNST